MSDLVEVLATFNPGDTAFVKSLLDGAGVTYFVVGEGFNQAYPSVEPVRFLVPPAEVQKAKEVLSAWDSTESRPSAD